MEVWMWWWGIIVVLGPLGIYILFRVAGAGWYRSKHEATVTRYKQVQKLRTLSSKWENNGAE